MRLFRDRQFSAAGHAGYQLSAKSEARSLLANDCILPTSDVGASLLLEGDVHVNAAFCQRPHVAGG